jgi:hypothetical protein
LYYAVTGKVPFPGGTAREKARNHCQMAPLDPRRLSPDLPDEFVDAIAAMMAKNPAERMQTAAEVVARLSPFVGAAGVGASQEVAAVVSHIPPTYAPPMPVRLPDPNLTGDTEPNFLVQPADEPGQGESPSQLSLGTQPVSAAGHETLPSFTQRESGALDLFLGDLPPKSKLVVMVLMGLVGCLVVGVLLQVAYHIFFGGR